MVAHICLCIMLITMTYNTVNAKALIPNVIEARNNKLSEPFMLEQFGMAPNHQDDDDNTDEDETIHEKRHLKRKWATFYHGGAQSPYTIAFPALIRSRRWIVQDD